ncbi:RagB/SusD family nutrient uptake outer membrane protein [Arenibacter sp. 6A1]|uniref:RagB/SusD family nutrient uptake outer membrane protein n=1 Tax=Arenibacter sp. 6A1 TaxID=2720391 RepID=UPI0014466212|nr:RagB/SusD family nutrient uptake outer membrane protein [Arenibacter sp. 6A1]NKI27438.1 RagB/SusD family nutrient uptake outer membrane protein [Arenibacter sp. 6A1]
MINYRIVKNFAATVVFGLLFTGCTDLEPELYSDLTTKNAYSTESDIDAALTGTYSQLNPYPGDAYLYYAGYLVMISDYATDMGFSTAAGDPTKMSNFTYDDNNRYFRLNWRSMYQVISNVNILLSKIDDVAMDETKKNQIKGQARFLRALAYRDLTDSWGPVPLITSAENPTESENLPLAPVSEVDALIIEDCQFAAEHLPEQWDPEYGIGRASKGAALTLAGKVYMRSHDYSNAKIYIDQVLKLRDKGVYSLNPDFKNEWSESNKMDMGLIFGILHEASQNGGEITNHFGPSDHKIVQNRWQYYAVSLPFWRKYSDLDPRKDFFYFNYEGASPRDGSTSSGFYYKIPEVGETAPPNDTTRLLQNVATKKYSHEMISNSYLDGRTIQVFRMADVILCKAEIENALSGPAAGLPYLNEVRIRAGAPAYGSSSEFPVPATQDDMINALVDERGYELVFEYHRRPDLIRLGKYVEISNAYLTERGLAPIVTPNMRYFPYPLEEALIHDEMQAENVIRLP